MTRRWKPRDIKRQQPRGEWVGGRFSLQSYVTGQGTPCRPDNLLWIEVPDGLVVHQEAYDPRAGHASMADSLQRAIQKPMAGRPRRPARARVESPEDAAELRARFGNALEVVVGPTPEIDEISGLIEEHLRVHAGESWLDDVAGGDDLVELFFTAANLLYRAAPWKRVGSELPIRVDIPALRLEGGCVSIIGQAGQSFGFLLFPSLSALDAFALAAEQRHLGKPFDIGTPWLALDFERGADVPAELRKILAKKGLSPADSKAFPCPSDHGSDGMPRPMSSIALSVLGATAAALSRLFLELGKAIEHEAEPVSVTIETEGYPPVRLTVPYEDLDLFEDEPDAAAATALATPGAPGAPSSIHQIDGHLVGVLGRYASDRFGKRWLEFEEDFEDSSPQLAIAWSVYVFEVSGKPIFEHFLAEPSPQLSSIERDWLEAQRAAWLSIWEVVRTEPGVGLELVDLLTGERRFVHEVSGSKDAIARTALLGRVVECRGEAVLCGLHPRPLAPTAADPVVQAARKRLRSKGSVPVDKLRPYKLAYFLLKSWELAVEDADARASIPPKLVNTDGDDLLMTVDHFSFSPDAESRVRKKVAALDWAEPDDDGFSFLRPGNPVHKSWDNTVVGRVVIAHGELRIETNSLKRADELRSRIESACGSELTHRAREHSDPESVLRDPNRRSAPHAPREPVPPETLEMMRDLKRKHLAAWVDTPIPALGGKTPRAAVKTANGKKQVDLLLRQIEFYDARHPDDYRTDLADLRRELGLA